MMSVAGPDMISSSAGSGPQILPLVAWYAGHSARR